MKQAPFLSSSRFPNGVVLRWMFLVGSVVGFQCNWYPLGDVTTLTFALLSKINHDLKHQTSIFSSNQDIENDETAVSDLDPEMQTGLTPKQVEELDELLTETLYQMAFVMESEFMLYLDDTDVQQMFRNCIDGVVVAPSTLPEAGMGLFAQKDIPKGTIVAFYPVHSIGCKFESGACQSVQLAKSSEQMIDNETSAYAIFSCLNRPLCGVELTKEYPNRPRLYVDMNPLMKESILPGWYCGYMNDAATVRYLGDEDYYPKSRSAQNVEIVPFGPSEPFLVGVTTKDVRKGQELFVSYGYDYWKQYLIQQKIEEWSPKPESILEQEQTALAEMFEAIESVKENYGRAAEIVAKSFDSLGGDAEDAASLKNESEDLDRIGSYETDQKSLVTTGSKQGKRVIINSLLRKIFRFFRNA